MSEGPLNSKKHLGEGKKTPQFKNSQYYPPITQTEHQLRAWPTLSAAAGLPLVLSTALGAKYKGFSDRRARAFPLSVLHRPLGPVPPSHLMENGDWVEGVLSRPGMNTGSGTV